MSDYREELEKSLESNRKKVAAARNLKAFKDTVPSVLDVIDDEISYHVNKMAGQDPLSQFDYLEAHGGHRALIRLRNLLDTKVVEGERVIPVIQKQQDQLKQISDNDRK